MITQLRDHERADKFLNDVRANQKARRNYGRYVYIAAVIATFLYLGDVLVGNLLWLRAEGLILSDHVIVASPYAVQVTKMAAQPGQLVKQGDVLATVSSPQIMEAMATLTSRAAETTARQAELAIKLEVANAVMKTAEERLKETEVQLRKVNSSRAGLGFVSDAFAANVQKDRYAAMQEKVSREAERRGAIEQLAQLDLSLGEARQALEQLRRSYNDGIITAPADGTIGPKTAVQGDVLRPGDNLMQLYVGHKFALVYLETGTLYEVKVGDPVKVADGFKQTDGTISEIQPITVPLPAEFQRAFRPPSRGQVAKIRLDAEATFPLASKVTVAGRSWW
ncbi:HlyD family secretion protein [Bosea rubneri]|uniref:Efflux RND transporter periplasmic adaptor subunit n=1 Tax=Bosea rubneri TaxID=3075434 RepID=A0ABU3SCW5_9HYPH|nr:HlyD family efflux transporter periplasmic adaptor subunit [Bosea sp. ZW T0_25]MDU0342237.1 efflux RND transporter periplasmic adaptor subunit [Bosea sp. ZW T0_25]